MGFGEPGSCPCDARVAGLEAAVIAVDRLGTIVDEGCGIVEPETNVLEGGPAHVQIHLW